MENAPIKLTVFGIAVSPMAKQKIDAAGVNDSGLTEVPVIVDSRMTGVSSFAYFTSESWQAKCKEQRNYDQSR